jgi:hypothetical protein
MVPKTGREVIHVTISPIAEVSDRIYINKQYLLLYILQNSKREFLKFISSSRSNNRGTEGTGV